MQFHELPPEAQDILAKYAAPPRLVAHLTVVHDLALKLIKHLRTCWPMLEFDQQRVLFGAATHDMTKRWKRTGLRSDFLPLCTQPPSQT